MPQPPTTAATTIHVTVRCFSHVRAALRRDVLPLELACGSTAADVAQQVREMGGAALAFLPMRIALNHQFVLDSHLLSDGDEVALIPPVQGG